ncbi:DUF4430 domain-containing protein [Olsenella sp. HMSC062G07]|uniref:DUF4430 domain-containing protein n=1 Tax=Olsenella sp. HMSC062G07 TaxID=1739330 RepID=UPI0008A4FE8F|nr:DUF4430 domain-containing protein [Olsenella sp. HMSC062G07]OFK23337.1 hypothetical protein HMPREF2826_05370 [Olsenella sp. HMSC062G07]
MVDGRGREVRLAASVARGCLCLMLSVALAFSGVPAVAWAQAVPAEQVSPEAPATAKAPTTSSLPTVRDGGAAAFDEGSPAGKPDGPRAPVPAASAGVAGVPAPPATRGSVDEAAARAARDHVRSTYLDGSTKIISNGGDAVVKGEGGLSYQVGYKSPSESVINTLNFRPLVRDGSYTMALTVRDNPYVSASTADPTKGRFTIHDRPQGAPSTVELTLSVYEKGADVSTASPLATFTFSLELACAPAVFAVDLTPHDAKTGAAVAGATVTVREGASGGPVVSPSADGSYPLDSTKTYHVTVSADGYEPYVDARFTPMSSGAFGPALAPLKMARVRFRAVDAAGNEMGGASVQVRRGSSWGTPLSPQADGSYEAAVGTTLVASVTAPHYATARLTHVVTGAETAPLDVVATLSENVVTFVGLGAGGLLDEGARFVVTHEEEDWEGMTETVTDAPTADGSYVLSVANAPYTVTARGSDGTVVTQPFTPSTSELYVTRRIKVFADPNQMFVDQAAKALNGLTALRPQFGHDTNVNDLVLSSLGSLVPAGLRVEVASTDDAAHVAQDGSLRYVTDELDGSWGHFRNVSCTFRLSLGQAEAVSAPHTVTVCWDQDFFRSRMQAEADGLADDAIKGSNTSLGEVTGDLALPQLGGAGVRGSYAAISWESSDPSVVSPQAAAGTLPTAPLSATVTRQATDRVVTLTATFAPNASVLNDYVESAAAFGTVSKTFTVTVKADPLKIQQARQELADKLDAAFTYANVTVSTTGAAVSADGTGVTERLRLPRPRVLGVDGRDFSVTYASSDDALGIVGYAATPTRPLPGSAARAVDVTCTIASKANPEVTASKTLTFVVDPLAAADVDDALELMEQAKAGYAAALLSGQPAGDVTRDLATFQKAYRAADGTLAWARTYTEAGAHEGIVLEDLPGYDPMGAADQARTFVSNNTDVIVNETLHLAWNEGSSYKWRPQPRYNTAVTVRSVLSDERFVAVAQAYGDDPVWGPKLRRLVSQDVAATLVVKGTSGKDDPTGSGTTLGPNDSAQDVTASVRVVGPDARGRAVDWLPETTRRFKAGTTALSASREVLASAGYDTDPSLLTIIARDGKTLPDGSSRRGDATDQRTGARSFWRLYVNGTFSAYLPGNYTLRDGDRICWSYGDAAAPPPTPSDPAPWGQDTKPLDSSVDWAGRLGNDRSGRSDAPVHEGAFDKGTSLAMWLSDGELSDPILVGGKVIVASGDRLFVLNPKDGSVFQIVSLAGGIDSTSRLQYADEQGGLVLVPLSLGRLQAFAVGAKGLVSAWVTPGRPAIGGRPQQSLSTVLVQGGAAYLGTTDGFGTGGFLYKLRLADGAQLFERQDAAGYYWAGGSVRGDVLLIANDAGCLQAIDAQTGGLLATVRLGEGCRADVALSPEGTRAYVVTTDGVVHVVEVGMGAGGVPTLRELRSAKVADHATGAPILAAGRLVVGGGVQSAGSPSSPWTGSLSVLDAETLSVVGTVGALETGELIAGDVKGAPLLVHRGGAVYDAYFTSNALPGGLYVARLDLSAPNVTAPARRVFDPSVWGSGLSSYCMGSPIVGRDGTLYFANSAGALFALGLGVRPGLCDLRAYRGPSSPAPAGAAPRDDGSGGRAAASPSAVWLPPAAPRPPLLAGLRSETLVSDVPERAGLSLPLVLGIGCVTGLCLALLTLRGKREMTPHD